MEQIGDILPVLARAAKINLSEANVCAYTGISSGTLARAKNGLAHLPPNDWLACKTLVLDCEELQRRANLPIAWINIRVVKAQLETLREERKNPPEPPSHRDWELMSLVADRSLTPTAIAANLGISLSELHEQFAGAIRRVEHVTNRLGTWISDIDDLNKENLAAVDANRAKRNQ